MRRGGADVEREAGGSWAIPADHIDRAAAYEARRHRDQPVDVETLSARPLDQLRDAAAATWVDRELASRSPLPIRDAGFGRDVRAAMAGQTDPFGGGRRRNGRASGRGSGWQDG